MTLNNKLFASVFFLAFSFSHFAFANQDEPLNKPRANHLQYEGHQNLTSETKDASAAELQNAAEKNRLLNIKSLLRSEDFAPDQQVARPFADFEAVKYLIFSGYNGFSEARRVKSEILKNLPEGVQVIVYDSQGAPEAGKKDLSFYSQFIELIRLTRVYLEAYGTGFWSRDTIPVPVYLDSGKVAGVDAKYYRYFEPDQEFAKQTGISLIKHDYYHEGGNFLADTQGRCFIVNNPRSEKIPDALFQSHYGCVSVHRFPHVQGIGHIDERVKIINDQVAMTDTPSYTELLQSLGYQVILLPKGNEYYETYVNSILINGTVFLPVFKQSQDQDAISAYSNLGFDVKPIFVDELPNSGHGSLHCITMTYPEIN